jgi:hypothetical protein
MTCGVNVAMLFVVLMIADSLAANASLVIDIASLFAAAKSRLIAAEVPADNDTSAHSLPSSQQWYPNSFEASIVALAWAQLGDASRAVQELNALVDAQWSNGLLPSTVFDARRDSEFPTASFWNANASEFASRSRSTSGVPHPPMIAQTLRFALNRVNVSDELSQFASTRGYDSARRFHEFLAREHDASSLAAGCLWIMHPWSTVDAATPLFDAALDAFQIGNFQHMLPKYNRTTTQSTDGIAAATYDRLVVLLVCGAFHEWDALLMAQYCPFRIVDPLFMSLAARDAQALAHVATMLGKSDDAKRYGDLAGRYVKCLEEKLWDEQLGAFVRARSQILQFRACTDLGRPVATDCAAHQRHYYSSHARDAAVCAHVRRNRRSAGVLSGADGGV